LMVTRTNVGEEVGSSGLAGSLAMLEESNARLRCAKPPDRLLSYAGLLTSGRPTLLWT
jgi:hypothetical protein